MLTSRSSVAFRVRGSGVLRESDELRRRVDWGRGRGTAE